MLKTSRKIHIYNNDQHTEGVFDVIKRQPDRNISCDEPVLYFYSKFKDLKENDRSFIVSDLERSSLVGARRQGNAKANNVAKAKDQTEDKADNDVFMIQDSIWDTGETGPKADQNL